MARLRTPFVSGTITDNPLAIGATTLNAAGLAGLPAVVAPNTVALILDPTGVGGAPEVVFVTAHTAVATSATISRGQEGTVARAHLVNTIFVHAPTVFDFGFTKGADIASASALTLPASSADYFNVTGTTTITSISAREGGRRIALKFNSALTVSHNANIILSGGANLTVAANTVLEFVSEDGGIWRQVGLSPAVVTNHEAASDPHTGYVRESDAPGGELGGTYASPTVDATHSGSAHHTHTANQAVGSQIVLPTNNAAVDLASVSLVAGTYLVIASGVVWSNSGVFANCLITINVNGGDVTFVDVSAVLDRYSGFSMSRIVTVGSTQTVKITGKQSQSANGIYCNGSLLTYVKLT